MNKTLKTFVQSAFVLASLSTGVFGFANAAQAWETFRVGNYGLNANRAYGTVDGQTKLTVYSHNVNDKDQQFERRPGNRGGILLKNRAESERRGRDMCLNAYRKYNGAPVNVWPCNPNDPDQNFKVSHKGSGSFLIEQTVKGQNDNRLCIDSDQRRNGGRVHLWTCNSGNPNQRWYSSNYDFPRLTLQSKATNRVLDSGTGYGFTPYMHDGLSPSNPYHNFHAVPAGDGYYYLLASGTGRVLDGGGNNGKGVYQHPILMKGNHHQMWKFNRSGDDFYITNRATNYVLDSGGHNHLAPYMHEKFIAGNRFHLWALPRNPEGSAIASPGTSLSNPLLTRQPVSYFQNRSQYYGTTGNGYAKYGFGSSLLGTNKHGQEGNCTWYAFGRLKELGFRPTDLMNGFPDAKKWDALRNGAQIISRNATPRVGDIAQWVNSRWGHVAVVEKVDGDYIYISESHWGSDYDGDLDRDGKASDDGTLHHVRRIPRTSPDRYLRPSK